VADGGFMRALIDAQAERARPSSIALLAERGMVSGTLFACWGCA
jgi:hypothetical protein